MSLFFNLPRDVTRFLLSFLKIRDQLNLEITSQSLFLHFCSFRNTIIKKSNVGIDVLTFLLRRYTQITDLTFYKELEVNSISTLLNIIKNHQKISNLSLKLKLPIIQVLPLDVLGDLMILNTTLNTLTLSVNYIVGSRESSFVNALKQSTNLKSINLMLNTDSNFLHSLGEALKCNTTLTTFRLLATSSVPHTNCVVSLIESFQMNPNLQSIQLECVGICNIGATIFSKILEGNPTLQNLDLSGNKMSDFDLKGLFEAIKYNTTLKSFQLTGNFAGYHSAQAAAETLKTNSTLTNLDLTLNSLDNESVKLLAESLIFNKSLETLGLSGQSKNIDDETAFIFAEIIKSNKKLKWLSLSQSSITNKGAISLMLSLKNNKTLKYIGLNATKSSQVISNSINDIITFGWSDSLATRVLNRFNK